MASAMVPLLESPRAGQSATWVRRDVPGSLPSGPHCGPTVAMACRSDGWLTHPRRHLESLLPPGHICPGDANSACVSEGLTLLPPLGNSPRRQTRRVTPQRWQRLESPGPFLLHAWPGPPELVALFSRAAGRGGESLGRNSRRRLDGVQGTGGAGVTDIAGSGCEATKEAGRDLGKARLRGRRWPSTHGALGSTLSMSINK